MPSFETKTSSNFLKIFRGTGKWCEDGNFIDRVGVEGMILSLNYFEFSLNRDYWFSIRMI